MCGIAGAIDRGTDRARVRVEALNDRQRHRGPDNAVVVHLPPFTLGNTRLAIQDLTPAGNQPFSSADGRYVCVFNGEIYNAPELIRDFDLRLSTRCDGAVIPALWARLGASCLARLRGMFAIALVDSVESTLTLCRDPFGIKPLFFRRLHDGSLIFASEPRPLAAVDPVAPVDAKQVASFLRLGSVPAGASPFLGVEAVPPNTALQFTATGGYSSWPVVPGPHPLTEPAPDEKVTGVGAAFEESVALHLRSDVPTALLLSSGVDSAAIAAAAQRQGITLHCLTIAGKGTDDEVAGAARTAAQYGHEHDVVPLDLEESDIGAFFEAMPRPTVDGLNTFIICRAVQRQGFRVALSGLGGDEAFGGYPHFKLLPWLPRLRRLGIVPNRLWSLSHRTPRSRRAEKLRRLLPPNGPRSASGLDLLQRELLPEPTVRELAGIGSGIEADGDDTASFRSMVEAEHRYYLQSMLLPDADAFSMCSSVELRVPFVDRPLVLASVSPHAGSQRAPGKSVLAADMGDDYLKGVVAERKRGFSVPVARWLRDGPLGNALAELQDPGAPIWGLLDRSGGQRLIERLGPQRGHERWALVALNGWLSSVAGDGIVAAAT